MAIIYSIILLAVIIIIHECGHFICAKWAGLYVPEFSIGMGPKLFQKQIGETKYTLRLFPIGGYVAMAGEESAESNQYDTSNIPFVRTFKGAPHYKQLIITLAGVVMNFVLAFVLFFGIFAYQGQVIMPPEAYLAGIIENSPASDAGLLENDRILQVTFVDGSTLKPKNYYDFMNANMFYSKEDPVVFLIGRGDETLEVMLTPKYIKAENATLFGFKIPGSTIKKINAFEAIPYALKEVGDNSKTIFMTLSKLVTGRGFDMLSGPVGIYKATETTVSNGVISFIALIAMLSVNVGIFNLLPLPILDGGRAILILFEMITKKKVNEKFEMAITTVGMVLFLALFLFVTWNDISRIFFS